MRLKSLIQRHPMSISRLTLKQTQYPLLPNRSPPTISLVARSLMQLIERRSVPTSRLLSSDDVIPEKRGGLNGSMQHYLIWRWC